MDFFDRFGDMVMIYGLRAVGFMAVIMMGWWIARYMVNLAEKGLIRSRIDVSVHRFILAMTGFFLKLVVLITAASIIGVPVTTFIAMLSAAGLAVGLALKDSLSNFAAGILLLIFRPFSVGDFIETSGFSGTVLSVEMLYTALNTIDNRRIMVPNGMLATSHIINYSVEPERRIDKVYAAALGSDILLVRSILLKIVAENSDILTERGIILGVGSHNEHAINFELKFWVNRQDFLKVSYAVNEQVILEFERNGIRMPYPVREVQIRDTREDESKKKRQGEDPDEDHNLR